MASDNKNFVFSQPVEMEVDKQNKTEKTEKEQPNKKEYDVRQVKAMFEGKDMAECFAVMYINHNKTIVITQAYILLVTVKSIDWC